MKICIFHPYEFNGEVGGTDIYVLQLIRFLQENGCICFLVCPGKSIGYKIIKSIKVYEVDLYPDNSFRSVEGLKKTNCENQLHLLLKQENPDIVHFHGFGKPYLSMLNLVKYLKIKTILTPHLASLTCMKSSLLDYRNNPCDGSVAQIKCSICLYKQKINSSFLSILAAHTENNISTMLRNLGIKNSGKFLLSYRVENQINLIKGINSFDRIFTLNNWYREVLIKNGIVENKILNLKTSYKKISNLFVEDTNEVQVLFAGRQNNPKGLPLLLMAIEKSRFNKNVHLNICGPIIKSDEQKINFLLHSINQKVSVSKYGNITHEELVSKVKRSQLVVLPSVDSEMCPLIVLEAQANCIPVLGADHTGISDLITEGKNGFLFRRNNIDDLRLKLERLINSNQLLEMNKTLNKSFVDEQSFLENHLIHYRKLIEER